MMVSASKRIKRIATTQSFAFSEKSLSRSCFEGRKMSSKAGCLNVKSGGRKRSGPEGVIVDDDCPKEKRRKMGCGATQRCSPVLKAPTKHPASGRVFSQPLDPKALKQNPVDDETSMINQPSSSRKASRAARLKPQQRKNTAPLDHYDKAELVKAQPEKKRFERNRLAEGKTKNKADRAAAKKKTKVELKKQREREREAARIALQKMERTAGIELNLEIYKELEILSGCSLSRGNPLQELGLFIKQEYLGDDDEEDLEVEHGKILSLRLKVVDGSRKNCPIAQPRRNSSNSPKNSKSSDEEKVVKVDLNARVAENCATLTSQMRRFDVPHSGEGLLTPISDAPKKASHAAMLKSHYADIIQKSQRQLDKADPVKTQQEQEELERSLAEDEAKIRTAEAAAKEVELKKQREREREAARIALQKMERTAGIELNLEIFKELENLSGCSLSLGRPLHELGLFIKQEYSVDEKDEAILYEDIEEGEILP